MKTVLLVTDGACIGNPGPGGWACILRYGDISREMFGYDPATTNNRMEMMAAIQGLLALKKPCEVTVVSDSAYLIDGITKWIIGWKRRGWWKKGKPVRNADLWLQLDELVSLHQTTWTWTKGHAGHADDERCDRLAEEAARRQASSLPGGEPQLALRYEPGYIPPKPQGSLFDEWDAGDDDTPD